MKTDKKIIFVHIPKTAGTSFRELLSAMYTKEQISDISFFRDNYTDLDKTKMLYMGHFGADIKNAFHPDEILLITILRDPIDRVLSLYNYWHNFGEIYRGGEKDDPNYYGVELAINSSFEEFIRTDREDVYAEISNTQCRYIIGSPRSNIKADKNELYSKALFVLTTQFGWYATTKTIEERLPTLFRLLGTPQKPTNLKILNKTTQRTVTRESISKNALDYLRRINQSDTMLFEAVSETIRSRDA